MRLTVAFEAAVADPGDSDPVSYLRASRTYL